MMPTGHLTMCDAIKAGADIYSEVSVERILVEAGCAVGVAARAADGRIVQVSQLSKLGHVPRP